jgi:hypothetical protein
MYKNILHYAMNLVNSLHIHVLEGAVIQSIYYKKQCSNVQCEVNGLKNVKIQSADKILCAKFK